MAKYFIDTDSKKINFKKVFRAVYKTLNQSARLKAEVVLVSQQEIQTLNRENRNVDKVTDVLSFPSLDGIVGKVLRAEDYPNEIDGKYLFIGSIVLCEDKIEEQAKEYMHSKEDEMTYLTVHGLMHLFGYDHMTDEDKKLMREKEKSALKLLGKGE